MRAWLWQGGQFVRCETLPVTDRGFRYGMALFETVRLWCGQPLFLQAHLKRLHDGCADRRFPLDRAALVAMEPLLAGQPDGVARLYVTAGDGALTAPEFTAPRVLVIGEERPAPIPERCKLALIGETHLAPFGGLKTANYWANVDALHRALRSEHDEALLFNENSELISASTANIFVVRGGHVSTPALECGAREGVTREWVMRQMPVREGSLFLGDLQEADELFLTSSWYGVRPAATLEHRSLPSQTIGEQLAAAFTTAIQK